MTSNIFVVMVVLAASGQADGWGQLGHILVANVAWNRLSNKTQSAVKSILLRNSESDGNDDDDGSPLASVANWADHVRYTHNYHWSAPLHFVDVEDSMVSGGCGCIEPGSMTDCQFLYKRDCKGDFCVAGAITNYSKQLFAAPSVTAKAAALRRTKYINIQEALKFLTHFVGDIHQPLHVSRKRDRGGNSYKVKFNDGATKSTKSSSWNLHSVWDSGIIERALEEIHETRENYESALDNLIECGNHTKEWLACSDGRRKNCTSMWAEESLESALGWAYRNSDGNEVVSGSTLSDKYYETRLPIVDLRLAAGGVRLAATLERALEHFVVAQRQEGVEATGRKKLLTFDSVLVE